MLEVDHDDGPRRARQPECDVAAGLGGAAGDDRHGTTRIGERHDHESSLGLQARTTPSSDAMPHAPVATPVITRGQGTRGSRDWARTRCTRTPLTLASPATPA